MHRLPRPVAALAFALLVTACGAGDPAVGDQAVNGVAAAGESSDTTTTTAAGTEGEPGGSASSTTTTVDPAVAASTAPAGVVVIPPGGAPLSETEGGTSFMQVHEGVVMGFQNRVGDWLEVTTTCNDPAWVEAADVEVTPQATRQPTGNGFDLGQATIVLDPGHGDRDWGGVGPNGLGEKNVNLDIAEKVRTLMESGHSVDWVTGDIGTGSDVPAFGKVWLTRDRNGPNDGDFELGLAFRAEFANAAGSDVFVSIHNNTVPRIDTDIPGTEVFYAISVEDSDRLASLIYEELLLSFRDYEADWTGGELLGARARVDPATDTDYYGVLRRASMPAVIVEGVYISEPDQEALLDTDEFRQSYADGVYRGIVRFLTTDEIGTGIQNPELFPDDSGTVNSSACEIPAQP